MFKKLTSLYSVTFLCVANLYGEETTQPKPTSSFECTKENLLAFFPPSIVAETLSHYNIPKDKSETIIQELKGMDKIAIHTVEDRAAKMDPNPLKDMQRREAAITLLRETLLDLFSQVMHKQGINDEDQIRTLFDSIQSQKAQAFAKCLKE